MSKLTDRKRRLAASAAALMAITSCHGDSSKHVQVASIQSAGDQRYSIEVWEEPLVGGAGSHAAILIRDKQQDRVVVLQGLATDRGTGEVRPMGSAAKDDIYAYANIYGVDGVPGQKWRATLLQTNDGVEIVARMTAMLQAAEAINDKHFAYQLFSSSIVAGQEAYNSNATATSLLDAAGLKTDKVGFGGYAPGWGEIIPSGYKINYKQVKASISKADQTQTNSQIQDLAGTINARGELARSKDPIDRATARVDGVYVAQFVQAMDYNGEQARHEALPTCERITAPEFPRWDVVTVPSANHPLYAENITDRFQAKNEESDYDGSVNFDVVTDPQTKQSCKTTMIVRTRADLRGMMARDKQDDADAARDFQALAAKKPIYQKPKVRVRIDL